ncbi:hypothetical protein DXG03_001123 [Asterophora parasitica]|uniref:Protein kinase domain-containing protein n=1 Tax=Asterophora parasitica TaxID=117018 RepID=A0A9P7GBS8_9AGAR|nr:hypothetical protein DXG03_001123 [Asterophora parasitica]
MFSFPREEPRTFTAADIIAILKAYGRKSSSPHPQPKAPAAKLSSAEFIESILGSHTERRRAILRHWPRDPNGGVIKPENSLPGKTAPNGIQLWGATLFDFYRVHRIPSVEGLSTISTGSKLMMWMKANGELNHAKDEIEWAEMEDEPAVIQPWSPREAIEEMEENIRLGKAGKPWPEDALDKGKQVSTGSIFERSNYPAPGPLAPFSYTAERLTDLIPPERLPRKVIVHDPWNLLAVRARNRYGYAERNVKDADWTTKPDRTYTYKFKSSDKPRPPLTAEKLKNRIAPQLSQEKDNIHQEDPPPNGYLIRPPSVEGPIPPPIYVVHDPPPPHLLSKSNAAKQDPIEEAHLYLSPAHPIGSGNHSVVYEAEWELPRSAIIPPPSTDPVLCRTCVQADIDRTLKELDGEHGERMAAEWKEKTAKVTIVQVGRPQPIWDVIEESDLKKGKTNAIREFCLDDDKSCYRTELEGRVRPIRTNVPWQDPMNPTCEHVKPPPEVPPTVRVRVVAKLSNYGDDHLKNEADNYQMFARHMFETWSGLNVLPPMHDPVPLGALVPRFYGYYVRQPEDDDDEGLVEDEGGDEEDEGGDEEDEGGDEEDEGGDEEDEGGDEEDEGGEEEDDKEEKLEGDEKEAKPEEGDGEKKPSKAPRVTKRERIGYLSPILLLEKCGTEVNPNELTLDQRNEVTSFMYRFHFEGWAHCSVYLRNILVQPGPLNVSPPQRSMKLPSFRIIDFGRSYHCDDGSEASKEWTNDQRHEENSVERLFDTRGW